jgi:hypothetical protein
MCDDLKKIQLALKAHSASASATASRALGWYYQKKHQTAQFEATQAEALKINKAKAEEEEALAEWVTTETAARAAKAAAEKAWVGE